VAVMVWVIRILLIGTLSLALDRMLHPGAEQQMPLQKIVGQHTSRPQPAQSSRPMSIPQSMGSTAIPARPLPVKPRSAQAQPGPRYDSHFSSAADEGKSVYDPPAQGRPEPTYHSLNGSPRPGGNNQVNPSTRNPRNDRF